jgi:hypothetical protein
MSIRNKIIAASLVFLLSQPAWADGIVNTAELGAGAGSVTSVSIVTANGVSGTCANPTTTPACTIVLGAITPSSIVSSSSPGSFTVTPTITTGANGSEFLYSISTDPTTWNSNTGTARPSMFLSTLSPTTTVGIIWENWASFLETKSGTYSAEVNLEVGDLTVDSGATFSASTPTEIAEFRVDNSGALANYSGTSAFYNGISGSTATQAYGYKSVLTNAGTITTVTAFDVEAFTNTGTITNAYAFNNHEATATIATLGKVTIGNGAIPTPTLYVQGPDTSGSTTLLDFRNSTPASLFNIVDSGAVTISLGPLNENNTGNGFVHSVSLGGTTSDQFANTLASASALYQMRFGNNTNSTTYATITLNSSSNTSGNGDNSFTINGTGGLWLQGGGNNGLVINTSGNLTAANLATSGTVGGSLCPTAAGLLLYESGVNCFVANVATATGTLAVANGGTGDTGTAWTTYSPTASCSTSGTINTDTIAGRYKTIGKTVFVQVNINITVLGTCLGNLQITAPVTANATGLVYPVSAFNNTVTTTALPASVTNANGIVIPFATAPAANNYYVAGVYEST